VSLAIGERVERRVGRVQRRNKCRTARVWEMSQVWMSRMWRDDYFWQRKVKLCVNVCRLAGKPAKSLEQHRLTDSQTHKSQSANDAFSAHSPSQPNSFRVAEPAGEKTTFLLWRSTGDCCRESSLRFKISTLTGQIAEMMDTTR
jgi:hypothetical protein